MEVKGIKDKPTNILRSIGDTHISDVYLLDDKKTVFKQFKNNENLKYITNLHPNFPEYIRFLETLGCDALELPTTLYCKGFLRTRIDSYETPYVDGRQVDQLHPKTNIRRFISAFYKFSREIQKLDGAIVLHDAHAGNILYTGKCMKLLDVDFFHEPTKDDHRKSLYIINKYVLEYLIYDPAIHFMYQYPDLWDQYEACLRGELSVPFFLETLVAYIELSTENDVNYIRDINDERILFRGK